MTGEVRVLVYHRAPDGAAIEDAYHEVSAALAGVPGMLGNELLRSCHDEQGFLVVSRWNGIESFQVWEEGVTHRDTTAPLRPYRDTTLATPFGIYQVVAAY